MKQTIYSSIFQKAKSTTILLLLLFTISIAGYSQEAGTNTHRGEFSFGARTTGSLFSSSGNYFGVGAGGQWRYRIDEN